MPQEQNHAMLMKPHFVGNGVRGRSLPFIPIELLCLKMMLSGKDLCLKTVNKHQVNDFNKISPTEEHSLIH